MCQSGCCFLVVWCVIQAGKYEDETIRVSTKKDGVSIIYIYTLDKHKTAALRDNNHTQNLPIKKVQQMRLPSR